MIRTFSLLFFTCLLTISLASCTDSSGLGRSSGKPLGTDAKFNERLLAEGFVDEGIKNEETHDIYDAHVFKERRIGKIYLFTDSEGTVEAVRARYNTEQPRSKINMMINGFWHKYFGYEPELKIEEPSNGSNPPLYGAILSSDKIAARWTQFYGLNDITFALVELSDDYITY